jgi:poly(3-hydroxybutyrate) depolymerase
MAVSKEAKMKRCTLFSAVGIIFLLSASCSDKGTSSGGQGSGGSVGAGGSSAPSETGGTTSPVGKGGTGGASAGTTGTAGVGSGGRIGAGGATGSGGASAIDGGAAVGGATGTAPSAGCGKATTLTSARASIDVSGKTREYILALPSNYDPNHPYKLIFGWHPWGGSAQQVASGGYFGLKNQSNNQAIFVAGEGLDYQSQGLGWGNANGEDVAFYHAMLDRFRSELCIDENRIFATGFSFGAMFSFTLGCTSDSMLRAIMPMAGNATTSGGCAAGTRKVAVMAFIGTDDSLISGHRQAVSTYATRDGCSSQTQTMSPSWCDGLSSSNLPCTCVSYQGCADGYPVVSCEYKAGHQQAPNPGPIWSFLAQF